MNTRLLVELGKVEIVSLLLGRIALLWQGKVRAHAGQFREKRCGKPFLVQEQVWSLAVYSPLVPLDGVKRGSNLDSNI